MDEKIGLSATIDYSREATLLKLLEHLLIMAGFKILRVFNTSIISSFTGIRDFQFAFVLSGHSVDPSYKSGKSELLTIYIEDDERHVFAKLFTGPSSLMEAVVNSITSKSPVSIRIGSDILFSAITPASIQSYANRLQEDIDDIVDHSCSVSTIDYYQCEEWHDFRDNPDVHSGLIEEISKKVNAERTMYAMDDIDEPKLVMTRLALKHANDLVHNENQTFRLPLLVTGEQIRAIGFLRCISDVISHTYGVILERDILRYVLSLGYIHLYIAGVESWRTGADLDPNTYYFAELLRASRGEGRFTISCRHEDVVQYLSYSNRPDHLNETVRFTTVGDRFKRDPKLKLLSLQRTVSLDQNTMGKELEKRIDKYTIDISEFSQNLITPKEVKRLIEYVAVTAASLGGYALRRRDLPSIIKKVIKGDRCRVINIQIIESSLLTSGPLDLDDFGLITFISAGFHACLISRIASYCLSEFFATGAKTGLNRILETSGMTWWVLDRALSGSNMTVKQLPSLLRRFDFFGKTKRGLEQTSERLNLLRIYQLCMARTEQGDTRLVKQYLEDLESMHWQFYNQAMGQFYFRNTRMEGWVFEECDLRSSFFDNCDLDGASFKRSFLGGVIFLNCKFGKKTNFSRSELSGAMFIFNFDKSTNGSPGDFSKIGDAGLQDINLTAANIRIKSGKQNLERRLSEAGALLSNVTIRSNEEDDTMDPDPLRGLSDEYIMACARCHWKDASPVITPLSRFLFSSEDAAKWIAGWNGPNPASIKGFKIENNELLLAESQDGLCIGVPGGQWRVFSERRTGGADPGVLSISEEYGQAVYMAGTVTKNTVEIWKVKPSDAVAVPEQISSFNLPPNFKKVTCMLWVRESNPDAPLLLLLGGTDGDIYQYTLEKKEGAFFRRPDWVPIVAMAYAPRQGMLYIAGLDNTVQGYRFDPGRDPLLMFSFHTAHRKIEGLEVHPGTGHVFVSGPGQKRGEKGDVPLFALANVRGDVLAVWPESGVDNFLSSPMKLSVPESSKQEFPDIARELTSFNMSIQSFVPQNEILTHNPYSEDAISIELRSSDLNAGLPSSEEVGGRHGYRICEAQILNGPELGELIDTDFEIIEQPSMLKLRFRADFPPDVSKALVRLNIRYPGLAWQDSSLAPGIERDVNVSLKRDNNPFIPDGRPVEGAQFFGLKAEFEACLSLLREERNVIVTAPRRSGKTSFLRQLARHLSHEGFVCVVVTGETMESREDFFESIYNAAEDFQEAWEDYRGITRGASPSQEYGMIKNIAEAIRRRQVHKTGVAFIILFDEWGVVRNRVFPGDKGLNDFMGKQLPDLNNVGACFCLSSVPRDFELPLDATQSDFFRYIPNNIHIGKLRSADARDLIRIPLERLGKTCSEIFLEEVLRITSCAPDDLNKVMFHAYSRANEKYGGTRIGKEHLTGFERSLLQKYGRMRSYLYDNLGASARKWLLEHAGTDEDGVPPIWDTQPLLSDTTGIESSSICNPELIRTFTDAGFRQPLEDFELGKADARYKLWIPWGLTLWLRQQAKTEKGGV